MHFIIGGHEFPLEDLDAPLMEQAFFDLYCAYFGNGAYKWADFEKASFEFFDKESGKPGIQDKYFTNFTIIWKKLFNQGQLEKAELLWKKAIELALSWEAQHKGQFIHKGTPFYFWGMTALLRGDLDKGFVLIHRALEEDIRTESKKSGGQVKSPNTPAFAFAALDYGKTDHALRNWVQQQANFLSDIIAEYNKARSKQFSIEDFRKRFLSNLLKDKRDIVFLFVYSLARLRNLQCVPYYALKSTFAGQLELNLLFDITLVVGEAIKAKNPTKWKFFDHAVFLSRKPRSNLNLNKNKLGEINGQFNNNNFDTTLSAILNNSFQFSDKSKLGDAEGDLAIAYGVRNHAAHNVSSAKTVYEKFDEIRQRLFNTLFLVVETLY